VWKRIPEEMMCKSFGTEEDALYEEFLGEGVILMIFPLHRYIRFWTMTRPAFSRMKRMITILRDFNHINRQKTL